MSGITHTHTHTHTHQVQNKLTDALLTMHNKSPLFLAPSTCLLRDVRIVAGRIRVLMQKFRWVKAEPEQLMICLHGAFFTHTYTHPYIRKRFYFLRFLGGGNIHLFQIHGVTCHSPFFRSVN